MRTIEFLRAHVITVPPSATVREMVDLLDLYQVLVLPVVDEDNRLLGAIYEDEIVAAVLCAGSSGTEMGSRTASELMESQTIFVDELDEIDVALERMSKSGRTRLPVTSGGKVVGTISRVDICQALLEHTH